MFVPDVLYILKYVAHIWTSWCRRDVKEQANNFLSYKCQPPYDAPVQRASSFDISQNIETIAKFIINTVLYFLKTHFVVVSVPKRMACTPLSLSFCNKTFSYHFLFTSEHLEFLLLPLFWMLLLYVFMFYFSSNV